MSQDISTPQSDYEKNITQEIRFAVVFYGGVSLCVYMGGVAQELLSLVRSTADINDNGLTSTEKIYRELGRLLYASRDTKKNASIRREEAEQACKGEFHHPIRTRFVVDILTGSSAGGINAVALAKALALKLKNLKSLTSAWKDDADLGKLLQDVRLRARWAGKPVESLLDGDKMYQLCSQVISNLSKAGAEKTESGYADEIDLFVTATDLEGLYSPIRLADRYLQERIHRTAFHFRYRDPSVAKFLMEKQPTPANTQASPQEEQPNQFGDKFDEILAFAARCTSSFPVAFPPMSWAATGHKEFPKEKFDQIFRHYSAAGGDGNQNNGDVAERRFGDGGAIDVRPFSYALEQIRFRTARRPAQRKLIFVDPFPERVRCAGQAQPVQPINFLKNLFLQASGLPRYDTIRAEIEAVNASNRLQDRLDSLWEKVKRDGPPSVQSAVYRHLRVSETTDALARLLAGLSGFDPDSDECFFIRQIVRAWRSQKYDGKDQEFLDAFDIDFLLRRLNRISWLIDQELIRLTESKERALLRPIRLKVERVLQELRSELRKIRSDDALRRQVSALTHSAAIRKDYLNLVTNPEYKKRECAANKVLDNIPGVEQLGDKLIDIFAKITIKYRGKGECLRDGDLQGVKCQEYGTLDQAFTNFEQWDEVALLLLAGSDVKEFTRADVYCIGPAEGDECKKASGNNSSNDPASDVLRPHWLSAEKPLSAKLKGTELFDFGAFTSRDWRHNDLMWGRLDAAEKLVKILLPIEHDDKGNIKTYSVDVQNYYIERLYDAILSEELDKEYYTKWAERRLKIEEKSSQSNLTKECKEMINNIPFFNNAVPAGNGNDRAAFIRTQYDEPPPAAPGERARWIGTGLTILGWMIEDLHIGVPRRPALWLRAVGTTCVHAVRFSMPNTLWQRLFREWAWLVVAAGGILLVAGVVLGAPVAWSGGLILGGGLLIVVLHNVLNAWLAQARGRWWRRVRTAGALAGVAVALVLSVLVFRGGASIANCVASLPQEEVVAAKGSNAVLRRAGNIGDCLTGAR